MELRLAAIMALQLMARLEASANWLGPSAGFWEVELNRMDNRVTGRYVQSLVRVCVSMLTVHWAAASTAKLWIPGL
jgi:hypothetical protein